MIPLTFSNVILYICFVWGVNAALNVFYISKKKMNLLSIDRPLDFGVTWFDGRRILGESTTILGLVVVAIISLCLYRWNIVGEIGYIVPFTTYLGHALGSFIKRRMNIARGGYLPFIDHGDSIAVTGVVLGVLQLITPELAVAGLFLTYVLQPFICLLGYRLGLRDHPY
jgi:CDP-2,3-bis-(O-geranylgeranyl)-sn-glycerol synthase